jgi:putative FmdB family regulatory protein
MPTYDYECKKCGRFEVFQPITEEKLKKCPTCKSPVKRLLGAGAGIIFKGTGFYQTDYRSDGYKRASSSEASGGSAKTKTKTESSGTPGKTESKTELAGSKTTTTKAD